MLYPVELFIAEIIEELDAENGEYGARAQVVSSHGETIDDPDNTGQLIVRVVKEADGTAQSLTVGQRVYIKLDGVSSGGTPFYHAISTTSMSLLPMHVLSIDSDHLVCRPTKGSTQEIEVYKPYELMRTPFHGKTFAGYKIQYDYYNSYQKRTIKVASSGSVVHDEIITPVYNVIDNPDGMWPSIILAASVSGWPGDFPEVETKKVSFVDINWSGRTWAVY